MSELQYRVNRLRYTNGLSRKEVAEVTNQPMSAINFLLFPSRADFLSASRKYRKKS